LAALFGCREPSRVALVGYAFPIAVSSNAQVARDEIASWPAAPAADSIYVVAFWLPDAPDSLSRAFVARFRRVVGRDPQSTDAMSHDALLLAATAIRTAGASRRGVRDYLRALGRSRPPFAGVTGPITCTASRPAALVMAQLRHGVPVRVVAP